MIMNEIKIPFEDRPFYFKSQISGSPTVGSFEIWISLEEAQISFWNVTLNKKTPAMEEGS